MTRHFRVVAAIAFAIIAAPGVAATSQDDIDDAQRAQQLAQAQQAAAEARKSIAEAQAAEAKAKLGTLDTSTLTKPTGTAKTLNVEGNILAYSAAGRIAQKIADAVAPPAAADSNATRPVVILGEKEVGALQQANSFRQGVTRVRDAMVNFKVPTLPNDDAQCTQAAVGGAGIGILGSLDVALQIAQIFKVDKSFEGSDITLDEFALSAQVAKRLRANGVTQVVYGPLYVAGTLGNAGATEIEKVLDGLGDAQVTMDIRLAEIDRQVGILQARQDAARGNLTASCQKAFDNARRIDAGLQIFGKSLKDRADKFQVAATTVDEKTGTTLLQSLVTADRMSSNLKDARILRLKPVSGGGTVYIRTTFFSTHVGVGGGAVVSFLLLDGATGDVLAGDTVADYGGFAEPQDLAGMLASVK